MALFRVSDIDDLLTINGGNKHEFSQKEDKSFCVFPDDRIYDHAKDIFFILC